MVPFVTAIVSTFNAERFFAGCLEDLRAQTIFPELEIVIVDSASTQSEGEIFHKIAGSWPNARYIRTPARIGLYDAWNIAIGMARGKYLTSANTDDRHAPSALEALANTLERNPAASLAYADQYASGIPNETFSKRQLRLARVLRFPDFSHRDLMQRCVTGSQPLWRADCHSKWGSFDPAYTIAGDYEYWLRIAQSSDFVHVPETLGVFFDSPATLSVSNRWLCESQSMEIRLKYLDRPPWRDIAGLRAEVAQELFGIGYRYVARGELTQARDFLKTAWALQPTNIRYAKTFLIRGVAGWNTTERRPS